MNTNRFHAYLPETKALREQEGTVLCDKCLTEYYECETHNCPGLGDTTMEPEAKEAILQQLHKAWKVERDAMLAAGITPKGNPRLPYYVRSHGANSYVNAIGTVLSDGKVTWDYQAGVAWLKEQGEDGPYQ